ncbi:ABC transporter permease subunit [Luteimonas sp. Y-2-2-4F]|nr:ABC transporter permease subunit [Luteimonas sp. Y-2-2-4F]MCD9032668.1 ABC transporter permease subunit [Luteimonas sp. Y-2-2-4F]
MSTTSRPELAPAGLAAPGRARWRLPAALNVEAVLAFAAIALAWHAASRVLPPFLFPPFGAIGAAIADVLTSPQGLAAAGATYLRILAGLAASFALAVPLGLWAGFRRRADRALLPLVQFAQGVPAVCWVIFAVLWFKQLELRIAFVVIVSTLPVFFYQVREGVRSVPQELTDMVRALRPTRLQLVRKLVLPSLAPQVLTAWRLNLGSGTKVTIMAELLGGISGIGHQLRLSQELFRMDQAIAWTVALVAFVLATNALVTVVDRRLLRWRVA